jgi:hypothetical protein
MLVIFARIARYLLFPTVISLSGVGIACFHNIVIKIGNCFYDRPSILFETGMGSLSSYSRLSPLDMKCTNASTYLSLDLKNMVGRYSRHMLFMIVYVKYRTKL